MEVETWLYQLENSEEVKVYRIENTFIVTFSEDVKNEVYIDSEV